MIFVGPIGSRPYSWFWDLYICITWANLIHNLVDTDMVDINMVDMDMVDMYMVDMDMVDMDMDMDMDMGDQCNVT